MKLKVKLDSDAIKKFFTEHAEKLGVAAALCLLIWFVAGAFKRETLPPNLRTESITDRSRQANEQLVRIATPPANELPPPVEVDGKIVPPATGAYDFLPLFKDTPLDDPNKNGDPNLFPIMELQAWGFRGAVAVAATGLGDRPRGGPAVPTPTVADTAPKAKPKTGREAAKSERIPQFTPFGPGIGQAAGGPRPIPQQFFLPGAPSTGNAEARAGVIVTGAVPEELLQKAYDSCFQHSMRGTEATGPQAGAEPRGPQRQLDNSKPQYMAWRLERTELDAAGKAVETKTIDTGDVEQVYHDFTDIGRPEVLKALKPGKAFIKLQDDPKTWAGHGEEVVAGEFLGPAWLSWPLPPLLLHDWGREAAHPAFPWRRRKSTSPPPPFPLRPTPKSRPTIAASAKVRPLAEPAESARAWRASVRSRGETISPCRRGRKG